MVRTALPALVLLLSLSAVAGALPGQPASGTPRASALAAQPTVMTVDDPRASDTATTAFDLGASVALEREASAARLDRYVLDERFSRAGDDESRREFLFRTVIRAKGRAEALRAEERALRAAYANRSIDTATFVLRLVRIDARQAALRRYVGRIGHHADRVQGLRFRGRLQTLNASLTGFDGPVRNRLAASIRGEIPPTRVYVEGSPNGAVLATITDGLYVREAYRSDRVTPDSVGTLQVTEAVNLIIDRYPSAYNASQRPGRGINLNGNVGGGLYQIEIHFGDGRIVAFLDGDTEEVFYEVQERQLVQMADSPTAVATANGTRLAVDRTHPGGPLRIAVADNETGSPVAATVIVDGTALETGDDGVLWTLSPGDVRFTVTAVGPDGRVTTAVRSLQPDRSTADRSAAAASDAPDDGESTPAADSTGER